MLPPPVPPGSASLRMGSIAAWAPALALALALVPALAAPTARAATFRIEIDYMVGAHSHMPQPAEIQAVQQMFACHGHTLIVDVSDALPHHSVLQLDPNNAQNFFNYSGVADSFKALKNQYYDHAGQSGWHYCIFGHNYETTNPSGTYIVTGSSGLGEFPGDDFVVTLGGFTGAVGTPFDRASTLAHEFGHNLGLDHCLEGSCDVIGPFGPNHPSIMSYAYQLRGVRSAMLCDGLIPAQTAYLFKDMDYSNGTMCSLNESNLDEQLGTTMRPVNWNCSGALNTGIAQDLNGDQDLGGTDPGWCANNGALQTIVDGNEWAALVDVTLQKSAAELDNAPTIACITADEVGRQANKWTCPAPVMTSEPCIGGRMLYVSPGAGGVPTGNCSAPYGTVKLAANVATPTSALFLRPGTYAESGGGPVYLSQRLWIFAVKGARVQ